MKKANNPEDIAFLFLAAINAGDIAGLVSLYEENAVLVTGSNFEIAKGSAEIREFYKNLLSTHPQFEKGNQRPALINGDIALTSSRLVNGYVTAEVARKQEDGTWKWIIDQPVIAIEST